MFSSMFFAVPKYSQGLDAAKNLIITVYFIITYNAFGALVFSVIHIPVNLISMGIWALFPACLICVWKRKKGWKNQEVRVDWIKLIGLGVLTLAFLLVHLKVFSFDFRHSFNNDIDPANHFRYALNVVRTEKVSGMYFAALFNSFFISVLKPILSELEWYRAFIMGVSVSNWLGMITFYVLALDFLKNKRKTFTAAVVTLLYWFGYPLYSYIGGNFVYWEMGVMLTLFLIMMAHDLWDNVVSVWWGLTVLLLAMFSVAMCYVQFAPMVFGSVFVLTVLYLLRCGVPKKIIGISCLSLAAVGSIGIVVCLNTIFKNIDVLSALKLNGCIYTEFYRDFFLLIPAAIFVLYKDYEKKECSVFGIFLIVCTGFTCFMFVLMYLDIASVYYYMKNNYMMWMLLWLCVVRAIGISAKSERGYLVAYAGFMVLSLFLCGISLRNGMPDQHGNNEEGYEKAYFEIYKYNAMLLHKDYEEMQYSQDKFDIMRYVIENLNDTRTPVAFLMTSNCKGDCYWYEAFTQQNSRPYYWNNWLHEDLELLEQIIEEQQTEYAVVLKRSQAYQKYPEYFDSFNEIYENDEAKIIQIQ